MSETSGDWARRHARLGTDGRAESEESVVRADPPEDDWRARHAWCKRQQ